MKNILLYTTLLFGIAASAQPHVQPLSSGDFWKIDEYNNKLRQFAAESRSFPSTTTYPSGAVGVSHMLAQRGNGANEIQWSTGGLTNVNYFIVEYSRDNYRFERAGQVELLRTADGGRYVFRHPFNDNSKVYYRIGIVNANNSLIAYTPSVQLLEENNSTKVFPTVVRGNTFQVQIGMPYDILEVVNSANQSVYTRSIKNVTGNITVSLPTVATGIYFVRLLSNTSPQHVQRIMVERL